MKKIISWDVKFEQDVVLSRQYARQAAELLGFDSADQARIAASVSELARNAIQYASGAIIELCVNADTHPALTIQVRDQGPGIDDLDAALTVNRSQQGMGLIHVQRLMDNFHIESAPGAGTTVTISKLTPKRTLPLQPKTLNHLSAVLNHYKPDNPYEEIKRLNLELMRALGEQKSRLEEIEQLNAELEETNRGVVALYAELDEKADSLRRASELKSRFLYYMSHEFRTPLNSILSLTQLLLDRADGELALEQVKQVEYIRKSTQSLYDVVNDLLDMAKVEAGKLDVQPQSFSLSEFLGALRGMMRPLTLNSPVSLMIEEPQGIDLLWTDEQKLTQILRNFISNAIKFTPEGEIRVSVSRTGQDRVLFTVADTGIGIAPDYQEIVFEEYTQVKGPHQKRAKGTGLGLPLARKLAELLGGRIFLESQLGVGSTFFVEIPIHYSKPDTENDPFFTSTGPTLLSQKKSILLIETVSNHLHLDPKIAENSGYRIFRVQSFDRAQEHLQQSDTSAVVIHFPVDRNEVAKFLQFFHEKTSNQNIHLAALVQDPEHSFALELGIKTIWPIPENTKELIDRLNDLKRVDQVESILIIDDEDVSRYILTSYLSDLPYRVIHATDGRDGLSKAKEIKPRCIFLDMIMPGLNGFEVLTRLKKDPYLQDIPVIIYTSMLLNKDERKKLSSMTVDIVTKEQPSRDVAIQCIHEAMIKAGLKPAEKVVPSP